MKRLRVATKQQGQFRVENFYDLLTRRNTANNRFTERFLFYASNEFSGDLKINIRFKQRHANLTQCSVDVRLADNAVSTEVFENLLKSIAKLGKHDVDQMIDRLLRKFVTRAEGRLATHR